jgi:ubiquinone/menaquinone biosynthesis C-methylase UbiE
MDTIESLAPWFYEFDLGPLGRTPSALPAEVQPIHSTRLQMMNAAIDRHFSPQRLRNARCLDVGCHEGFYSVALAQRPVREVVGVDVRLDSLRRACFVSGALGLNNVRFEQRNAEAISPADLGQFDLTLCLGLIYHLENPMICLRNIAAVTKELCVVETQVVDEIEGFAEWGAKAWTRPYQGILALIDETAEYEAENRETGATPLATCPSPRGLEVMLKHAGFTRVEFIEPPAGAYEQLARRKRVVCAAYK